MKKLLLILALLLFAVEAQAQSKQRRFNCNITSTATVLTELTDCAAVSGQAYHIEAIQWSSSIISTTTNFMLLQYGTGTACATGTTSLYAGFSLAFVSVSAVFPTPIRAPASNALCFVHPGAGTRNVTVTGFLAP